MGKYGVQVQGLLKKAAALQIDMLCPLHGPIWRKDIGYFINKYDIWSKYEPEQKGVVIVYGSIYGHTAAAAERLATLLAEKGVREIAVYDASQTDVSILVSEAFRFSHIVIAAATYNGGIFTPVENLLHDLKAHNFQNRHVALIENGTWAAQSGKQMRAMLDEMKGLTVVGDTLTLKSAMQPSQEEQLATLADAIVGSMEE